jgi:hypothetical protein
MVSGVVGGWRALRKNLSPTALNSIPMYEITKAATKPARSATTCSSVVTNPFFSFCPLFARFLRTIFFFGPLFARGSRQNKTLTSLKSGQIFCPRAKKTIPSLTLESLASLT